MYSGIREGGFKFPFPPLFKICGEAANRVFKKFKKEEMKGNTVEQHTIDLYSVEYCDIHYNEHDMHCTKRYNEV